MVILTKPMTTTKTSTFNNYLRTFTYLLSHLPGGKLNCLTPNRRRRTENCFQFKVTMQKIPDRTRKTTIHQFLRQRLSCLPSSDGKMEIPNPLEMDVKVLILAPTKQLLT